MSGLARDLAARDSSCGKRANSGSQSLAGVPRSLMGRFTATHGAMRRTHGFHLARGWWRRCGDCAPNVRCASIISSSRTCRAVNLVRLGIFTIARSSWPVDNPPESDQRSEAVPRRRPSAILPERRGEPVSHPSSFKPGDLHAQRRLPVEPLRDAGHITLLRKAKEILLNVHRAAPGNLA